MKRKLYIFGLISLGLASCSVERPFEGPKASGTGEFSKFALNLDVTPLDNTRAGNQDVIDDFTVVFQKTGTTPMTVASYRYGDMPDVITLDAGTYTVYATYGENQDAAWEKPYFEGQSSEFSIVADKITTSIDPIECKLENVKVSIDFHSSLYSNMRKDDYVEVYVNPDASLRFTKEETRSGYFKHSDVCTLTATFHGMVDGVEIHETRTLSDVEKGNHYSLTFAKHEYSADSEDGNINTEFSVLASVTIVNLNENITIADDEILDDKERPSEDEPNVEDPTPGPTDPDDPEDPDGPSDEDSNGPVFEMDPTSTVELEKVCDVNEESVVILNIHSDKGIEKFLVQILSDDLTELIGGDGTLNLVEPGNMLEFLQGVQILQDGKETLKGEKDVTFDVTGFMPMLMLVEGTHKFVITVGDADGENTVNLILNVPVKDE